MNYQELAPEEREGIIAAIGVCHDLLTFISFRCEDRTRLALCGLHLASFMVEELLAGRWDGRADFRDTVAQMALDEYREDQRNAGNT